MKTTVNDKKNFRESGIEAVKTIIRTFKDFDFFQICVILDINYLLCEVSRISQ